MYDSRIARFFAVDPITAQYPMLTPYQHSSLNPIWMFELEGLEGVPSSGNIPFAQIEYLHNITRPANEKLTAKELNKRIAHNQKWHALGIGAGVAVSAGIYGGLVAAPYVSAAYYSPAAVEIANEATAFTWGLVTDEEYPVPAAGDNISKYLKHTLKWANKKCVAGTSELVNGILKMDYYIPKSLRGKGVGTKMFNDAMMKFGDEITGVKGSWLEGDNLKAFNDALKNKKSLNEAAFSTPTGKWAKDKGFTNVQITGGHVGDDGYEGVEVLFTKPKN